MKISLGTKKKNRISFIKDMKKGVTRPEFYMKHQFDVDMPGESILKIQVWDWNRLSPNVLIGETELDLEDRWFHKEWQALAALLAFNWDPSPKRTEQVQLR